MLSDAHSLLTKSSFWRAWPGQRLRQNLHRPMVFRCPLLGDGHVLITHHLGLPVLYWCQSGLRERCQLDYSQEDVWVAQLVDGWELTISEEGPLVFLVLQNRLRSVRATLEFGPLRNLVLPTGDPGGAPNQVRIRLRTGDQFQVLHASRAA